MFHLHQGFPPAVTGASQLLPLIEDQFVHGIFEQPGQIRRCGELGVFTVITASETHIASHQRVELADAAQPRRLQSLQLTRARSP